MEASIEIWKNSGSLCKLFSICFTQCCCSWYDKWHEHCETLELVVELQSFFSKSFKRETLKGWKSWFAVEAKAFEISIEEVSGKLRGVIVERGRGFFNWIKFGEVSLRCLLGGVEACCREEDSSVCNKVWKENWRAYKLQRCVNGAGSFILCSVYDVEAKRFNLIFPEGRGLPGGWSTLASKLRSLGVRLMPLPVGQSSFVGKKGPMEDSRGSLMEEDSFVVKVTSSQKDIGGKVCPTRWDGSEGVRTPLESLFGGEVGGSI